VITEEALEKTCRSRSGINLGVMCLLQFGSNAEDIDIAAQHNNIQHIHEEGRFGPQVIQIIIRWSTWATAYNNVLHLKS